MTTGSKGCGRNHDGDKQATEVRAQSKDCNYIYTFPALRRWLGLGPVEEASGGCLGERLGGTLRAHFSPLCCHRTLAQAVHKRHST
jgi:hypothetical protein